MKIRSKEEFDKENVFGLGQENTAFARYFIGNSYLNPLTNPKGTRVFWQTLPLSRDAGITGISIMPRAAAGSF